MNSIRYFPCVPANSDAATTVFRFFDEEGKSPERYTVESGWVEDDRLFLLFMNGEITDDDEISEDDAMKILKALELK
jgi:hypothetical protein